MCVCVCVCVCVDYSPCSFRRDWITATLPPPISISLPSYPPRLGNKKNPEESVPSPPPSILSS